VRLHAEVGDARHLVGDLVDLFVGSVAGRQRELAPSSKLMINETATRAAPGHFGSGGVRP
jgi:hypothetical protein